MHARRAVWRHRAVRPRYASLRYHGPRCFFVRRTTRRRASASNCAMQFKALLSVPLLFGTARPGALLRLGVYGAMDSGSGSCARSLPHTSLLLSLFLACRYTTSHGLAQGLRTSWEVSPCWTLSWAVTHLGRILPACVC
ncbi:hypothetical protein HYPSUDRAFT_398434 [Hypholoma sublateritium FD-334 SS-4]|uniref:Uncharacterized protein n=1 Tax=Hypholoma sublateritium (strain FD-334 SS-4) TaxID=945553 RepID=A0A0D2NEQ4_HYPSF|nr:hypothetical protein HYPSUDRAFT_398434 [Hypholoma sublateritium FD-334 SS-4]